MTATAPLSWWIDVKDLPDEGVALSFEASAEDRARLATHAGILSIDALTAKGEIRPFGGGVEVRLRLQADLAQACVVSLVPVPAHLDEPILRRYLVDWQMEPTAERAIEIAPGEEDPAEPLPGERLDLGPVLAEEFILALDPYPRAPEAKIPDELAAGPAAISPFAVLKRLKDEG